VTSVRKVNAIKGLGTNFFVGTRRAIGPNGNILNVPGNRRTPRFNHSRLTKGTRTSHGPVLESKDWAFTQSLSGGWKTALDVRLKP